ncbi:MAG: hypothetical protein A3D44_00445 [Candidatus Staskawiczbacteria bacterium RIFCSPHIGHO2_02_FULL_42_22]|uniref:Clp R domain-containing protein n=1 Tax=Candidatus Staskawiczbacteria bacterium RIFCSPHIGHO2_02_FULL_42_22 TaxID=1802207 RepID=A0A1G2I4H0_9BACT|nr:MAG: hypothetical protein A3D44_00445 [Candidatus Staskawiczbacteria bacterium RIFCSPHIGHO2_02_FULL_42_22]
MYENFTDRACRVMAWAEHEAKRFNHQYIGSEHVLLGLAKEGSGVGANALKNIGVDLHRIRLEVEKIVQIGPDGPSIGKLTNTPTTKRILDFSYLEARGLGHRRVGTEHLLLAILRDQESIACKILMNLGVKLEEVRQEVNFLLGNEPLPKLELQTVTILEFNDSTLEQIMQFLRDMKEGESIVIKKV